MNNFEEDAAFTFTSSDLESNTRVEVGSESSDRDTDVEADGKLLVSGSDSDDSRGNPLYLAKRKKKRCASTNISSDLKEVKKLLIQVCQKVDRNERCLKELQETASTSSSS